MWVGTSEAVSKLALGSLQPLIFFYGLFLELRLRNEKTNKQRLLSPLKEQVLKTASEARPHCSYLL